MAEEDTDADNYHPTMLFGRDLGKIPCFKSSFLNGFYTGFGSGLLYFLFTSRAERAYYLGIGMYFCSTLTYWCYCRYQFALQTLEVEEMKEELKRQRMFEGTKYLNQSQSKGIKN